MTTKTQSKNLSKEGNNSPTIKFNLVHILFLHGLIKQLPFDSGKDTVKFKNFITDMLYLFEHYINNSENEELKEKMNYSPQKDD